MNIKKIYAEMDNVEKHAIRETTVDDFRDEFNAMFDEMDSMFNNGNIEHKAYAKAALMFIHDTISDGLKGMKLLDEVE